MGNGSSTSQTGDETFHFKSLKKLVNSMAGAEKIAQDEVSLRNFETVKGADLNPVLPS